MSDRFQIRDTGVGVLDILDMIAQGRGYDSILNKYPQLRFDDIGSAAAAARDIIIHHSIVCRVPQSSGLNAQEALSRDNQTWSEDENLELRQLYRNGATTSEMARIFLRSRSEIERHMIRLRITQ